MINNLKTQKKPIFTSISLIITLLVISFNSAFAESDINRVGCRKKVICADKVKAKTICADELIVKTGCCACRTITAKDFMDGFGNLTQTFLITEPGKYCLGEDIAFAPADQDAVAIQILANDVKLDLCGHTLTQDNDTFEVFAIQIGEGFAYNDPDNVLKNITITNGSITKFTGSGIFCYNASFDGPTTEAAFEDLTFTDLNILDCGTHPSFVISGIYLESSADDTLYDPATRVAYKNVIIENCKINRCLGNGSIYIFTGDNIIVKNTQSNETVTEISVFGISFAYYITARNLQMFNCQGNGTTDLDPTATGSQVGSFIQGCINVYIQDCQFNDTFGEADAIVNCNFSNSQNLVAENCQFNNNRGGSRATNIIAGIHMSDNPGQMTQGNGMRFINCQFNGTRVANDSPGGNDESMITGFIAITLRNIIFENCQASNIITENEGFDAYGYIIAAAPVDPAFPFANINNISFINCTASDITGGRKAIGIFAPAAEGNHTGNQGSFRNTVIENCVVERISSASSTFRVAGIATSLYPETGGQQFVQYRNVYIRNCRVSDVKAGVENPFSAGILVESVVHPTLIGNSVSDCDRGILLTGTNEIIPNGFQVAASLENALAFPPVFIPLDAQLKLFVEPALPGSPFDAVLMQYSAPLVAPVSGFGEVAVDGAPPINDACETLINDLTGNVGVCRRGQCTFVTKTTNIEDAGGIATVVVQSTDEPPFAGSGAPTGTGPSIMISLADGNALINALNSNPPDTYTLTIDTIPSAGVQTFSNLARGNSVAVLPSQVNNQHDFILTTEDLTDLGWQAGDPIFYDCNGFAAIQDLVCSTTYFAIVYRPGFGENGVIMNNEVDNCSVSGYQDDRTPNTSSAWVNNFAFNSGSPASELANYDIIWSGTAPVYAGDLADYPTGSAKAYNISLVP